MSNIQYTYIVNSAQKFNWLYRMVIFELFKWLLYKFVNFGDKMIDFFNMHREKWDLCTKYTIIIKP